MTEYNTTIMVESREHVQTSLHHLLSILKKNIYSFTKQATLMRGSTILNLSLQLVFPGGEYVNADTLNYL